MNKTSLPTIGFDRFIKLTWAEYALDLAIINGEPQQLKKWLKNLIEGQESVRKTFNLLNNLWMRTFPETEQIRIKALELAPTLPPHSRIVLHWGMALANFEMFQNLTNNIGKLIRLQGGFNKQEIQQRMSETYSNQGTIPRAVLRSIQSICDWNVIKETEKHTYICETKNTVKEDDLLMWLLQAGLNRHKDHPVSSYEILRLPELFPFEFIENAQKIIRESSTFTIIREGLNQEYVILS
jgi:hypothetical protein